MFQSYFEKLENHLIKKYKTVKKTTKTAKTAKTAKKTVKSTAAKAEREYEDIIKAIGGIVPEKYSMLEADVCDSTGVRVDSANFLAVERRFKAAERIFAEGIPVELVRGSYNIVKQFNHKQLVDTLVSVANLKKVGQFEGGKKDSPFTASFVIALDSIYSMEELKNEIKDVYRENSVDPRFEVDLIIVLGKGIVIKDWSKKSSFIALDTESDSLMWFFVIMNEFLSITTEEELDLRDYIRDPKRYNEY